MERRDQTLWIMNAAVSMVLLVPLLLSFWGIGKVLARLEKENQNARKSHDQPPIIILSEAQGYSFESGKAHITPEFAQALTDRIIPQLADLARKYDCDIIEVIGHTDEQYVNSASNLDSELLATVHGKAADLTPGSNADLGLMRAWSVAHYLRGDFRLYSMRVYWYSAGQCILPDGAIAWPETEPIDDASRRRIEVRLRRSP